MRSSFCVFLLLMSATIPVFGSGLAFFQYSAVAYSDPYGGTACQNNVGAGVIATCVVNSNLGFSGSASAEADPGSLHAEAIADYLGVPLFPGYGTFGGQSAADAEIVDTLLLTGAPASGFLQVNVELDGSLLLSATQAALDSSNSYVRGQILVNGNSVVSVSGAYTSVFQTGTIDVPYSGSSVRIDMLLATNALCWNGPGPQDGATCDASALFSDTGSITGIGVLDSNDQAVSGASFTAASGYSYPSVSSATPEPSTFVLFAGVSVLVAVRRFRSKRLV